MTEDEILSRSGGVKGLTGSGAVNFGNGHEFEQTPGDGEGQRSLVCFSPWGHKESDMTERLNNNNNGYPSQVLTLEGGEHPLFQLNTPDPRQRHREPVSEQGRGFLSSFLGECTHWFPLLLRPGVDPSNGAVGLEFALWKGFNHEFDFINADAAAQGKEWVDQMTAWCGTFADQVC